MTENISLKRPHCECQDLLFPFLQKAKPKHKDGRASTLGTYEKCTSCRLPGCGGELSLEQPISFINDHC